MIDNVWDEIGHGPGAGKPGSEWQAVGEEKDLQAGSRLSASVAGSRVLVLRQGQELFAVENRCPHLGCSFLHGELDGYVLKCTCHDWTFDIRTGELQAAREIRLATYDCRVDSGKILVKVKGN